MRRLVVFQQMSLDGYFTDSNGDMTWAKQGNDEEFNAFTTENAKSGGLLIFGRVTYDLMASFWPTNQAHDSLPIVAERMNNLPKIVFSRTLAKASWNNTTLIKGDLVTEIRKLKSQRGQGIQFVEPRAVWTSGSKFRHSGSGNYRLGGDPGTADSIGPEASLLGASLGGPRNLVYFR